MKKVFILLILLMTDVVGFTQPIRVAILDFENISGIAKYDGLGKAMSSMLISDIEANVSPKRLQLVERAQIQKVLKEQNFQASGSVNKSTAVQAGKILGVNYLLVGDVYIINDQLIINARLTNTESGDIVFSKKQEGKTVAWLTLKTNIAKDIAISLSQPFTEPTIPDKEINVATITTFGNAIAAKDTGNVQMAETLSSTVIDFNPEFKYVDDLKKEIDELKKQVAKNTEDITNLTEEVTENVTDYLELGFKYLDEKNFAKAEKYFLIGLNNVNKSNVVAYLDYILALSQLYYNNNNYVESLRYSDIGLEVYPYFKEFLYFKYSSLGNLNRLSEFDQIVKTAQDIRKYSSDSLIVAYLKMFSEKNKVSYYTIEKYLEWKLDGFTSLIKAIRFQNYIPYYSEYGGEFYFNKNFAAPFNTLALGCIQEVYNGKPEHAASLLNQLDLSNSSNEDASEVKFSVAWYTMLSGDFTNAQKQWDDIVLNKIWRISDCADYGKTMMVNAGILKNSVQTVRWVYDKKNQIVYKDTIREYHPDGTIRSFDIPMEQRDTIKLIKPFWYYEYNDGRGFVTLNSIEAYIYKANLQFPIDGIIDCIKSSGCINWPSVSEESKMAFINWGHSYLLSGDINNAKQIYKLFPPDFKFSENFQHMTYAQVLNSDWGDFVKSQLITKDEIEKMNDLINPMKN
jgi:TolB-like protein/tetratricopeptide (TPR) repeat protein